jgi:hypothetical protein
MSSIPDVPTNEILVQPPSFTLRKHIWETFPVDVIHLNTNLYAIVWRRKEIVKTRASLPSDQWKSFEEKLEDLLFQALRASSAWTVEPAQRESHICVIRMTDSTADEEKNAVNPVKENTIPGKTIAPLLTRLNDIKEFFPVVWHTVSSCDSPQKTYSIEFHKEKLRSLLSSIPNSVGMEEQVKQLLLTALKASTAWTVESPVANELCRITMVSRGSLRKNDGLWPRRA